MKKKDFIWIFASIVLSAAVALLIFLPRSTKGPDDILAPDIAESSEEIPVFTGQDSGDIPAESVLGKNVQTTDGEKAGIETDLREISRLCRADYLQAEKIPSEYFGQENIRQEDIDAMEAALSSAGYCVENSDAIYPDYLENTEKLNQFWDHLFEHEVTMHIETDGSFQYLSNRIVYRSKYELPSPQARIEAQRFDMEVGKADHEI